MKNVPCAPFGELLRRARVAARLSQDALAERAGLSARGISDLERGARATPHRETVRLLAQALGLESAGAAALEAAVHRRRGPMAGAARGRGECADHGPAPVPPVGLLLPQNLPAQVTSFIGREREIAAVLALVRREDVRLVTLTGPGGVGKTRLVQQVASALAGEFGQDV